MGKRSIKFKLVVTGALLAIPYLISHFFLTNRNNALKRPLLTQIQSLSLRDFIAAPRPSAPPSGNVTNSTEPIGKNSTLGAHQLQNDVGEIQDAIGHFNDGTGHLPGYYFEDLGTQKSVNGQPGDGTRHSNVALTENEDVPLKKILLWNKMKKNPYFGFGPGRDYFIATGCRVNTCTITRNRTLYPFQEIDAVMWHARGTDLSLPKQRSPHTRYVFMMNEPPGHVKIRLQKYVGVFNWTFTYRHDADVSVLIGRVFKDDVRSIQAPPMGYATGKTKMAAWFVSNCNTDSRRERLARSLQQYISIDIYGKCGPFRCPRSHSSNCYTKLEREYKFYLSFENSLCKDYITEKFFKIMKYNVIPIVYGQGNYAAVAPPHSYINVMDFSSVKELADHLLYLDRNDTAYNEYFWWKPYYSVLAVNPSKVLAWCDLCERLHRDVTPKVYHDIHDWYIKQATCKKAKYQPRLQDFLNGKNVTVT